MVSPLAPGRLVLLVLATLFLDSSTEAQRTVGYVLDMTGSWSADSQVLALGGKLSEGATIKDLRNPPCDDDQIVIGNLHGDVLKKIRCKSGACYECRTSGTCYDPIQPLPTVVSSGGGLSSIFEAVMDLFFGKPDKYSVHRVRGPRANPEDGIAVLQDGQLDLKNISTNLAAGIYRVRFRSLSPAEKKQSDWNSRIIEWNWNPTEASYVAAPELTAGLFEISFFQQEEVARIWVLIVNPRDYPELSLHLSEMAKDMEKWGDDVSAGVKQGYLRASLEYLSEISAKRGAPGNDRR